MQVNNNIGSNVSRHVVTAAALSLEYGHQQQPYRKARGQVINTPNPLVLTMPEG